MQDDLLTAAQNGALYEGKDAIVWAVENGKKVYGLDPIAWAIESKKTIDGKDPIVWAVTNGKTIDGQNPIEWAEDNNHSVDKEVLKKHLDKKLRNQNISVQAQNPQNHAFNEIVYADPKLNGAAPGAIYRTDTDRLMVKPARKDLFDTEHRDVNAEYMFGSLYKRLLYNQAPDIQLMVQPTEMINVQKTEAGTLLPVKTLKEDSNQQTIAVTSRFFKDDFQTLNFFRYDNLAAWKHKIGSNAFQVGEICDQITSIKDKQALAKAINEILGDALTSQIDADNPIFDKKLIGDAILFRFQANGDALGAFLDNLKQEMGDSYPPILHQSQIKGFEKVIAACVILGESDYQGENIGVINQGTNDKPDYLAVKIDHGRSGLLTFTNEAALRAGVAKSFGIVGYNQMPFSALEFKNAIDEMVKISEEELRAHLDRREATLVRLGFSVDRRVVSYAFKDGVLSQDAGNTVTDIYTARILQNIKTAKELSKTLDIISKINAPDAIKNGGWLQSLGSKDPIVWACDNKYTIEGKDPLIWAVENGRKVEGREAVYSIKDKTPASNWVDEQFQNVDLKTIGNKEFQTLCNIIDACPDETLKINIAKKAVADRIKVYDTPALLYFEQKNIKLRDWANTQFSEAVKNEDHHGISNLLNAGAEPTEECLTFIIAHKSHELWKAITIDGLTPEVSLQTKRLSELAKNLNIITSPKAQILEAANMQLQMLILVHNYQIENLVKDFPDLEIHGADSAAWAKTQIDSFVKSPTESEFGTITQLLSAGIEIDPSSIIAIASYALEKNIPIPDVLKNVIESNILALQKNSKQDKQDTLSALLKIAILENISINNMTAARFTSVNNLTIYGRNIDDWANNALSDFQKIDALWLTTTQTSKALTGTACTLLALLGENVKNEFINNFVDLAEIHNLKIDGKDPKEWQDKILLLKEPNKKHADLGNAARLHEPYVSSHNVSKG